MEGREIKKSRQRERESIELAKGEKNITPYTVYPSHSYSPPLHSMRHVNRDISPPLPPSIPPFSSVATLASSAYLPPPPSPQLHRFVLNVLVVYVEGEPERVPDRVERLGADLRPVEGLA